MDRLELIRKAIAIYQSLLEATPRDRDMLIDFIEYQVQQIRAGNGH